MGKESRPFGYMSMLCRRYAVFPQRLPLGTTAAVVGRALDDQVRSDFGPPCFSRSPYTLKR